MKLDVLIAGAGIGGLTAAIALARKGHSVRVIEQTSAPAEVGAGVHVQPNAARVLHQLGLQQQLTDVGQSAAGMSLRAAKTGRIIFQPKDAGQHQGLPHYLVHRADLHEMLLNKAKSVGVELMFGLSVHSFTQDNTAVTLHTKCDKNIKADFLIAADGVRSTVRESLFGADQPVFTGNIAYRGIVPASKLKTPPAAGGIVGPGKHFVVYPLRNGELYNFVAQQDGEDWREESWTSEGDVELLRALYKDWDPAVTDLLNNVEHTYRWALHTREPMAAWSKGRVCLIGDACHPSLPNLAAGAAMAIEDGYIIADCLEQHPNDISQAFELFYSLRIKRCSKVQAVSAQNAKLFHMRNPLEQFVKQRSLSLVSKFAPGLPDKRLDWLRGYNAITAVAEYQKARAI